MAELTNLTDRISHLRDRKGGSSVVKGGGAPEAPEAPSRKRSRPERKFATDYFMLFVYSLLAVALVAQLALIVWLDVI
jgi:nitrate reductase NapE component